ncbi:MAG: HAD-IIIA family hydrolase [Bdellovibrionales bacterium]|nr:HAD-IIIA family hydrolase [Bdellovibrionales bacterium]
MNTTSTSSSIHQALANVAAVVMDVDGVLTDGKIWLGDDGEWRRFFYIRDGHGIKEIIARGYKVAWITGSKSIDISERAKRLGIHYLAEGQKNKVEALKEFFRQHDLTKEQTVYIGDDTVDLPVMEMCGLRVTVPDAIEEVAAFAHHTTTRRGGDGAVRELCDLLLAFGPYK